MDETKRDTKAARAVETTRDIYIRLYLPWVPSGSDEQRIRYLERWIKDFEAFLRDHRSQDVVSLEVQRDTYTACSACGEELEVCPVDEDNDRPWCASCGAEMEESPDA